MMIGRRGHDEQAFEDAWNGRAPRDEHVAQLVRFAEDLCAAAVVEPSADFRMSLRTRLMAEAATTLVTTPKPSRAVTAPVVEARPVRRRLAGVTAALVASAGVVTAVAGSASAVPGEMLYPVKRSVESVELALHRDDASRGEFQLARASERLAEARQLSDQGASDELIAKTLDSFSEQATDGSGDLFSDFTDSGEEESIRAVNDFAAAASVDLSQLSGQLPTSAAPAFRSATEAVSDLAVQASSLCGACTTADVQALVSAVTGLSKPATTEPAKRPTADRGTKDDGADTGGTATTAPRPATGTTQPPAAPVPSAPTTTKAPSLRDVTDPLIGGLLGDEEQEGLVPGLLNGLLGGGK